MDCHSFQHISRLIQNNPVFINQSNCDQAPVEQQLQCALYKLGHDGNASSFIQSASYWSVFEGHIHKTTSRIVEALGNLKDKMIEWPTKDEKRRESMENDTREGFLGCIGKVDGTDIILKNKPGGVYNGEIFLTRKKNTLWIFVQSVISVHGLSTFLQAGQILNMMPESILLPISKDIRKIILLPVNTF